MNNLLLDKTLKVIPNHNVRNLIFGTSDIRKDDIENYISNMDNLMMFSFFVYYKVWEREKTTNDILEDLFSSIYTTRDLTLEIISYILGELQIEIKKNNDSIFKGLITGEIEESKVPVICELIMQWKRSYNHHMMDVSKLREYYSSLLNTFSYLKNASLDDDYVLTIDEAKYDLSLFIKITEDDDYYLYSVEDGNIDVILNYVSYTRRKFFKSLLHKKDINNITKREV